MASVAADALGHVNTVVEVDEVGKLVDARPLQRFSGAVTGANRLEKLGIGPDLRMTVHASFSRRNAGEAGGFDGGMTVAAIDAESGDVVLMAERNWLRLPHTRVSDKWGTLHFVKNPSESSDDKDRTKDSGASQTIRTAMEDL